MVVTEVPVDNEVLLVVVALGSAYRSSGCSCFPIQNYSGVSVEFSQIKAAMGAPKQQMLPSFWSDNSTAITGDFKHLIVCDFPAGLASEFSRESPKKNQRCCIVFDYSVATIDCAPFNSSDIYLFINLIIYIH